MPTWPGSPTPSPPRLLPAPAIALGDLARQGSDAAGFAASGVHQNGYTTVIQQVLNWLDNRVDQT